MNFYYQEPEQDLEQPYIAAPTEDDLAQRFVARHASELRYVAKWGMWMRYAGGRWREEDTLLAYDKARDICRGAALTCNSAAGAKVLRSAKTIAAVERIARADRALAATVEQWDRDPWLLNTPGSVIDLKNGTIRPANPDDYMTKITAVAPDGDCPQWRAFIRRVTGGDDKLASLLARVAGYALTGSTQEHALFFIYGLGANGKSVFLNTVSNIIGDYHCTAPIETFTESGSDRHPTELAMLRGARMVTAIETEEGRRWAKSRIKALTGGDKISARFMRQDFFQFVAQFKLIIAGNHKPGLRSVDEAIRRRFNLIPFSVTIPKEERDPELAEKFKPEWPGILKWMIDGCRDWRAHGLQPPDAVTKATEEYLKSEDIFQLWLDDCCRLDPQAWDFNRFLVPLLQGLDRS